MHGVHASLVVLGFMPRLIFVVLGLVVVGAGSRVSESSPGVVGLPNQVRKSCYTILGINFVLKAFNGLNLKI